MERLMNILIQLIDPASCDGCPFLIQVCHVSPVKFNCFLGIEGIKTKGCYPIDDIINYRPQACIGKYGE